MPTFGQTPEALLGRNDSKNPATTCRGITSSGRPCRRALASAKSSTSGKNRSDLGGVIALVQEDGEVQDASFYCWQHKDQAEQTRAEEQQPNVKGRKTKSRSTDLFPLQEKSSIDTLVQRLGIDAVPQANKSGQRRSSAAPKPPRRTETHDFAAGPRLNGPPHVEKYSFVPSDRRKTTSKKPGFWASLCCIANDEDDYVEVVRHKKRVTQDHAYTGSSPVAPDPRTRPPGPSKSSIQPTVSVPARRPAESSIPIRSVPQYRRDSTRSQTGQLLSLIPQHLSPQTTSILLAELSKPISPHDEEGYIYIFWLTPQAKAAPAEGTARSLLTEPARSQKDRRPSDVMTEYSFNGFEPETRGKKTIMLKIGRANNVTRRMNEWQRQCGYALNLVRWYPYVPSSAAPSPQVSPVRQQQSLYPEISRPTSQRRGSDAIRKVPCVKRVERLVHLELAEKQVKRQCGACGKEHREWFEVEANQAGVKAVDECIRRWVGWADRQAVEEE